MIYIAIVVVGLYYYLFLLYYQNLLPPQGNRILQSLLFLVIITMAYIFLKVNSMKWLRMLIVAAAVITGLRLLTGMNWLQALFCGNLSVLNAYCFRGIFTGIWRLVFYRRDFLSDADTYYTITLFALPFALLFLGIIRRTIFPDNKFKRLLYDSSQLKLIVLYEILALLYLAVMNSGRYLFSYSVWYIKAALGSYIFTFATFIFVIYYSIRSMDFLEYQWRTQILEEQYHRQLRHYKSYQKYTKNFQRLQHDYKSIMGSLKSLIRANDNEKAIQLIDDIYHDMQKKAQVHKKYSQNVVLDAMLYDLEKICGEKEIRFLCNVFVPKNNKVPLLDSIRIFSNITNNAIEACQKVPVSERFIDITSKSDEQWITIQVINSYDGKLLIENGKLITTKSKKENHGFGLSIVKEIVENLGGFVIVDADAQNKTFLLRVHIPKIINDNNIEDKL